MIKGRIQVIHAVDTKPEIKLTADVHVRSGAVYFVPEGETYTVLKTKEQEKVRIDDLIEQVRELQKDLGEKIEELNYAKYVIPYEDSVGDPTKLYTHRFFVSSNGWEYSNLVLIKANKISLIEDKVYADGIEITFDEEFTYEGVTGHE